ncbi:MAG: hypothetical protein ACK4TL_10050 [Hyphomicrobiaceae bacterium]
MAVRSVLSAACAATMTLTMIAAAEAQSRSKSRDLGPGVVTACSIYGNGCQSAPIRRAAHDYEFRMPGGTWISCRQNCKDALREEVIDFWETQRERAGSFID